MEDKTHQVIFVYAISLPIQTFFPTLCLSVCPPDALAFSQLMVMVRSQRNQGQRYTALLPTNKLFAIDSCMTKYASACCVVGCCLDLWDLPRCSLVHVCAAR